MTAKTSQPTTEGRALHDDTEVSAAEVESARLRAILHDPLEILGKELAVYKELLGLYLSSYRSSISFGITRVAQQAVVGALFGVIAVSVIFSASIFFLWGIMQGASRALEVPLWLSAIVLGGAILLISVVSLLLIVRSQRRKAARHTLSSLSKSASHTDLDPYLRHTSAGLPNTPTEALTEVRDAIRMALRERAELAPNKLKLLASLDAWAAHHPWVTVGSSALAGKILAEELHNQIRPSNEIKESADDHTNRGSKTDKEFMEEARANQAQNNERSREARTASSKSASKRDSDSARRKYSADTTNPSPDNPHGNNRKSILRGAMRQGVGFASRAVQSALIAQVAAHARGAKKLNEAPKKPEAQNTDGSSNDSDWDAL